MFGAMAAPIDLLTQNPLFADLAPLHREQIAQHLTRHEVAAGVDIVRQGGPADALYVVEAGVVGVFRRDPILGLENLVARLEPPESFGEMAVVTGDPRSATCTALTACVVHRLGAEVFEAVVAQAPQVALGVARSLARRLERFTGEREVPWVSLATRRADRRLWSLAPSAELRRARIAPLALAGKTMTVAMVDPKDTTALDPLRRAVPGVRFEVVAASADDYERFVAEVAGERGTRRRDEVAVAREDRPRITFVEDDESRQPAAGAGVSGAQVVALCDEIVGTALAIGASDIHVEPERGGVGVRYRVAGELRARQKPLSAAMARPLVTRLKLLAKLDITDTRRPHEGRITVQVSDRLVDLRVSTMPSKLGEKVVLRVLDASSGLVDLKTLLPVDKARQALKEMIFRPHGLVLVTGPTGSGKTTTLYSSLLARRRPELNVVTVEDPIEYHLDGVTQIQVNVEVGTTFAVVLRSLLRQDPDVIMVGETRDRETAAIAAEASMTGHLVLTSVHTNGALDAVLRLAELGVEPHVLASSLAGVVHQRLVRRCCPACAEPFEYPEPIVERLFAVGAFRAGERPALVRGKGCEACGGTGFAGRLAVFELLVVNDRLRSLVAEGASAERLTEAAERGALLPLARYAGVMLSGGHTVPGEVLHFLQAR
jgi:type IV pilus assembly protein PilB